MKLFSAACLVAAATCLPVQARDMKTIQESGTLKVGMPADYAPLAYRDNQGKLLGYDVDAAEAISKQLGLKLDIVATSWPTLSTDLAADKFDVAMGGVTSTVQRAAQFSLSASVMPNGKIALANCTVATKLTDLPSIDQPSVKVVVNPGGTNQTFVDANIKQAQIIRVENNFDNLQALRAHTADLMVTDLIEGRYYQDKEPGVLCISTPKPFPGSESYKVYMLQKNNEPLLAGINQWLAGDGKKQLDKKWGLGN